MMDQRFLTALDQRLFGRTSLTLDNVVNILDIIGPALYQRWPTTWVALINKVFSVKCESRNDSREIICFTR